MTPSPLPAQPNQSLMEGMEVLLALARRGESAGVRELARELGMTPTRLQRYIATLAHLGFARQNADRRYESGPGIHALSAITLSASGLAQRALTILPELADLGVIVALGVLWRKSVSYLYFSQPGTTLSQSLGRASDYPAWDSVIGHVLMAQQSDAWIAQNFAPQLSQLMPCIRTVRHCGFARIPRENGEVSLGIPVGSPAFAGLAAVGHFSPCLEPELLQRLQTCAAQLTAPSPLPPL